MTETPQPTNLPDRTLVQSLVVAIPNVPLPKLEHIILGRSNGLSFLNAELELSVEDGVLHLNTTGQQNNFMEMSKDRGNPENLKMTDAIIDYAISGDQKLRLANVGVSVAVVVEVAGEDYLILARRPNGMLLLPSGYVDSATPGTLKDYAELALDTALKELSEEILVRSKDNETGELSTKTYQVMASTENAIWAAVGNSGSKEFSQDGQLMTINLGQAYVANGEDLYDLKYQVENPLTLIPTNDVSFLPSLDLNQKVVIDGQELQHGVFYYLRETKSGQLVYPFRMEIEDLTGLSMQHAETGPDHNGLPGDLKEVLDPEGIILAKLSLRNGLLTGETFQLVDGALVATGINPTQLTLSEVFNTTFIRVDQEKAMLTVTLPQEVDGQVIKTASTLVYQQLAYASQQAYSPDLS